MNIERIVLYNFGVYGGRHELLLAPPSPDKPIILIGALNGGGKTTLLDALQLAFYGIQAQCSGRGRLPYKDYLREMIHHGANPLEGAAIEVHFMRFTEGRRRDMIIRRAWHDGPKGIEEFVKVQSDGTPDAVVSEHWQEYIESYLPIRLSGLFFFDGEQITSMAEDGHASEILSIAIHSLLGLDLVDRLQADLDVLERRKRPTPKSREESAQIEKLEADVKEAESAVEAALAEMAHQKSLLDRQRLKELPVAQKKFRDDGGALYLKRDEISKAFEETQKEVEVTEAALRELSAGPLPFLLVERQLEKVEKQVRFEIDAQHAKVVAAAEIARDREVLKTLKRKRLAEEALKIVEATLTAHRPTRDVDESRLYLHPDEEFADGMRHFRETVLPDVKVAALALMEKARLARERLARLESQMNAVPDTEAIGRLHREVATLEEQVRQGEAAYRIAEEKHRQLGVAHEARQRELRRFLDTALIGQEQAEDDGRIRAYIPKVKATLAEFKKRAIQRHVATIERLILESFRHLLHKKNLVSALRIDPVTFEIGLTGAGNKPLPIERLSAGERQLLATAIIWGLAKASGRPMPTVIDTPLGRLDSSHRMNLVTRYFPVVSHQVILLSTDEEITGDYFKILSEYIGEKYILVHEEQSNETHIQKGYF